MDVEFANAMRKVFIAARRRALRKILTRGLDRGEIAAGVNLELTIDMIYGPVWYRQLYQHAPLNANFTKQLTGQIVKGP